MKELQIFKNSEFGELRVLEIAGKMYFPATACAKILGYKRPAEVITEKCKGSVKHRVLTNGGEQKIKIIPEGDLYRLIVNSKLPSAEKFESWVFDDVLPAIRKSGSYGSLQVEGINQETIKQIIETTVSTTIVALMKEIIPIIKEGVKNNSQTEQEIYPCEFPKRRRSNGIIDKLNQNLKSEVEQMLSDGVPYRVICDYLAEKDIKLSQMAVSKYARKYFDVLEMLRNNAYRWGI